LNLQALIKSVINNKQRVLISNIKMIRGLDFRNHTNNLKVLKNHTSTGTKTSSRREARTLEIPKPNTKKRILRIKKRVNKIVVGRTVYYSKRV
jgi:hypothetical protein